MSSRRAQGVDGADGETALRGCPRPAAAGERDGVQEQAVHPVCVLVAEAVEEGARKRQRQRQEVPWAGRRLSGLCRPQHERSAPASRRSLADDSLRPPQGQDGMRKIQKSFYVQTA